MDLSAPKNTPQRDIKKEIKKPEAPAMGEKAMQQITELRPHLIPMDLPKARDLNGETFEGINRLVLAKNKPISSPADERPIQESNLWVTEQEAANIGELRKGAKPTYLMISSEQK